MKLLKETFQQGTRSEKSILKRNSSKKAKQQINVLHFLASKRKFQQNFAFATSFPDIAYSRLSTVCLVLLVFTKCFEIAQDSLRKSTFVQYTIRLGTVNLLKLAISILYNKFLPTECVQHCCKTRPYGLTRTRPTK